MSLDFERESKNYEGTSEGIFFFFFDGEVDVNFGGLVVVVWKQHCIT